jgi:hypothetical protein
MIRPFWDLGPKLILRKITICLMDYSAFLSNPTADAGTKFKLSCLSIGDAYLITQKKGQGFCNRTDRRVFNISPSPGWMTGRLHVVQKPCS